MKILIVDDDELIVESICVMIERNNLDLDIVGKAYSGVEALHLFGQMSPDIVLTDITMPEMNGIELMRDIKKMNPAAKLIVLSAYREFEYAQQSLQIGAIEYILKPVSELKLIEVLVKVMKAIENDKADMSQRNAIVKDRIYYSLISGEQWESSVVDMNRFISGYKENESYRVAVLNQMR